MANFGQLAAEIGLLVWGTLANFNGFKFVSWLWYCSDVSQRKPTKLCMIFGHHLKRVATLPCEICQDILMLKSCMSNLSCMQISTTENCCGKILI